MFSIWLSFESWFLIGQRSRDTSFGTNCFVDFIYSFIPTLTLSPTTTGDVDQLGDEESRHLH